MKAEGKLKKNPRLSDWEHRGKYIVFACLCVKGFRGKQLKIIMQKAERMFKKVRRGN